VSTRALQQDCLGRRLLTKRALPILAIAFLIFFVITSPTDAAAVVHSLIHGFGHAFSSFTEFVKKL
jgi:hypothetical protein